MKMQMTNFESTFDPLCEFFYLDGPVEIPPDLYFPYKKYYLSRGWSPPFLQWQS